jgi:transketolase
LIVEAGKVLSDQGKNVRIVSFPSWELFIQQSQAYQDSVLDPAIENRIAVEAGVSLGWERWVGDKGQIIAVNRFGASAPYQTIYEHFGLTVDAVITAAGSKL